MRNIPSAQTASAPKTALKTTPNAPPASKALATAPAKVMPAKTAKKITVQATKKITVQAVTTRPAPVRVVAETPGTYFSGVVGRAWRMSGKHAVAYVQNAALAGELLATEPRHLAKSAMAVYYDRKGRPFAWQFRFDSARWDEVIGKLA